MRFRRSKTPGSSPFHKSSLLREREGLVEQLRVDPKTLWNTSETLLDLWDKRKVMRTMDGELPPRVGQLLPLVWVRIRALLPGPPPPKCKVKRRTRPSKSDKQVMTRPNGKPV